MVITSSCLYLPQDWRAPLMLFGLMPHLMPALQPPSVSHWQRATAVTGPWRSCCTPVVRDWASPQFSDECPSGARISSATIYLPGLRRPLEKVSKVGHFSLFEREPAASLAPQKMRRDSLVHTRQVACDPSQKWRGPLRFLPPFEMRPSSDKVQPRLVQGFRRGDRVGDLLIYL